MISKVCVTGDCLPHEYCTKSKLFSALGHGLLLLSQLTLKQRGSCKARLRLALKAVCAHRNPAQDATPRGTLMDSSSIPVALTTGAMKRPSSSRVLCIPWCGTTHLEHNKGTRAASIVAQEKGYSAAAAEHCGALVPGFSRGT